jgi:hypothetical protein
MAQDLVDPRKETIIEELENLEGLQDGNSNLYLSVIFQNNLSKIFQLVLHEVSHVKIKYSSEKLLPFTPMKFKEAGEYIEELLHIEDHNLIIKKFNTYFKETLHSISTGRPINSQQGLNNYEAYYNQSAVQESELKISPMKSIQKKVLVIDNHYFNKLCYLERKFKACEIRYNFSCPHFIPNHFTPQTEKKIFNFIINLRKEKKINWYKNLEVTSSEFKTIHLSNAYYFYMSLKEKKELLKKQEN